MYKITDKIEVGLNKVTPKALITLKEFGLYDNAEMTKDKEMELILNLFVDESKIKKMFHTLFNTDKEVPYLEIDLAVFLDGYRDFFGQLSGNSVL